MALLPYIDGANGLVDGAYFHVLPFCKRHCSGAKCQEHYEKMKCAEAGSYCCPYGLSSYVYTSRDGKIIFSGSLYRPCTKQGDPRYGFPG